MVWKRIKAQIGVINFFVDYRVQLICIFLEITVLESININRNIS